MAKTTCSYPGCPKPHKGHGWCEMHLDRVKRCGDPGPLGPLYVVLDATCSVEGCTERPIARNLCPSHYDRARRGGDPTRALLKPQATQATHNVDGLRLCTACDEWKPLSEYYSSPSRPYETRCKDCHRSRKRQYREQNPETVLESNRAYYERNREKRIANTARWAVENPERAAEGRRRRALRRYYRKVAIWIEEVDRDILFARDEGICGICRLPVDPARWELDHIRPVSRGGEHSYANAQVAHPLCNSIKSDRALPLSADTIAKLRAAHRHLGVIAA